MRCLILIFGFFASTYGYCESTFLAECRYLLQVFNMPEAARIPKEDPILRRAIFEVFGGKDYYTGEVLDFESMTVDHIVPHALGGPDNIFNYVPTSKRNNSVKGATFAPQAAAGILGYVQTVYSPKVLNRFNQLKETGSSHLVQRQDIASNASSVSKTSYLCSGGFEVLLSDSGRKGFDIVEAKLQNSIEKGWNKNSGTRIIRWEDNDFSQNPDLLHLLTTFYQESVLTKGTISSKRIVNIMTNGKYWVEMEINSNYFLLRDAIK